MLDPDIFYPFREGAADPVYFSPDPKIQEAKKYLIQFADKAPHEHELNRYTSVCKLVMADFLSRCVFEVDGQHYQMTAAAVKIKGTKFYAPQFLWDNRLAAYLVENNSGCIKPIPSPTNKLP